MARQRVAQRVVRNVDTQAAFELMPQFDIDAKHRLAIPQPHQKADAGTVRKELDIGI